MLAIDTDLIVRFLTADDPIQSPKARAIIDGGVVWVATTVLLETDWVLRSVYGFTEPQVAQALRRFGGLPTVALENPQLAAQALDWLEEGIDFADALHLGAAEGCDAFLTFDRKMIQACEGVPVLPVKAP